MLAGVPALLDAAVPSVFPAAQLLVADQGQVVLTHAAGDASLTTRFDLASLTKPLCTAALVLRALDEGRMQPDDRPRPDCTIEQLLCHSAGLVAVRALADAEQPSMAMRAAAVEAARREPAVYLAGTQSIYSDLGYILLGDALERAYGQRLDALFIDRLATPLGAALGFGPVDGDVAPTEGALRGVVHDDNARAMLGVAGHAGLFGNVCAVSTLIADWVAAWHGRASSLPASWVRRAWRNAGIPGSTWGLGWDHPSAQGSSAGSRWPRDGVGHLAFTGCSIWIDPARERWVVLLSNRVHPTRTNENIKQFRPQLHDAVMAALA
jgi:CubicO group peptidase (beta-lactamase class C family)